MMLTINIFIITKKENEFFLYFIFFAAFIFIYDIIYNKLRMNDINIIMNFIKRKTSFTKNADALKKS